MIARALLMLLLLVPFVPSCSRSGGKIVIGSKNFTEQILLGELLAQYLEAKTKLRVERRLNLGGTFICHRAIVSGQIDLYVEYTGTALTAILNRAPVRDPRQAYQQVRDAYLAQFGIEWLRPLGFENTFAIVVRGEDARRLNLRTISDLVPHAPRWRAGFGYEFMERADGFPGLARTYGLRFAEPPRIMDLGLIYRALRERQVDVVAGNSTDGVIAALDLVALEDDRHYFPPYEAVPIVRVETVRRHSELRALLEQLGGRISAEEMRRLNYAVDGEHRDPREVIRAFLRAKGLL
ncbi:Glycine betaine/carnitine/choline-binding protein OpuCC [bacterium HR10]|nr:Glycine betaine/carnitine/choline-binding protein OpuCC [bacterium HR10]